MENAIFQKNVKYDIIIINSFIINVEADKDGLTAL